MGQRPGDRTMVDLIKSQLPIEKNEVQSVLMPLVGFQNSFEDKDRLNGRVSRAETMLSSAEPVSQVVRKPGLNDAGEKFIEAVQEGDRAEVDRLQRGVFLEDLDDEGLSERSWEVRRGDHVRKERTDQEHERQRQSPEHVRRKLVRSGGLARFGRSNGSDQLPKLHRACERRIR